MRRLSRRRKLSMTSLIDVIFLLLLFFMLTSTFTRFAEVELTAGGGGGGASTGVAPIFAQLGAETLRLNGQDVALEDLATTMAEFNADAEETPVILALGEDVTAQRLVDGLGAFRAVDGLTLTVLGGQ